MLPWIGYYTGCYRRYGAGATVFYSTRIPLELAAPDVAARARKMVCRCGLLVLLGLLLGLLRVVLLGVNMVCRYSLGLAVGVLVGVGILASTVVLLQHCYSTAPVLLRCCSGAAPVLLRC